ncbi:MAG TPA: DUF305 domain-containing protein [Leptolyngbyaceae cyanobacterium M33_DOE_097]|uniref:DUF305 domain-containing protein n=1 Tax=Oscillatoriales cyanobacterium SpSt-418 TaxID=2282169 RepID=A0A7C3KID5_9CYAN|nr:DUF305 domain-containing protein [Leptolyngbyaceae cyanobacterium M33_DOE_097]
MLRASLIGFIVVAATFSSSLLTACSSSQNASTSPGQASSVAAETSSNGRMDHSQMSHNMDLGPADNYYDLRFIDSMIPHHRGAIEMANEALQKSNRPEIKTLAQNIIKAQNREENELMRKWRKAWYPNASDTPIAWHSEMGHSMSMSPEQVKSMMMTMDLGAADDQFDLRFLNAMIPHHEGAVVMAQDALSKSTRPEIKQLANEIIASQQAEINQMKQWRKSWYNQ